MSKVEELEAMVRRFEDRREENLAPILEQRRVMRENYHPFQPLFDRVLLRAIQEPKDIDEKSGLHLPEVAQHQTRKAEVVSVGDGLIRNGMLVPIRLAPGDLVLISEFDAETFTLDGEELISVRADDLRGVMRKKKLPYAGEETELTRDMRRAVRISEASEPTR